MADFVTKDSGERKSFPSGMKRDVSTGKIRPDLCRKGPMFLRWAELLARGAEKYGPNNWMLASSEEELERAEESACRHFEQWLRGDTDEDHAAAVIFNLNEVEYIKERLAKQPLRLDKDPEPPVPRYSRLGLTTIAPRSSFFNDPEEVK